MEYKDPVFELLSSLEQIVLKIFLKRSPSLVSRPHLASLNSFAKALA